jgi:hypothetical protein
MILPMMKPIPIYSEKKRNPRKEENMSWIYVPKLVKNAEEIFISFCTRK